MFIVATSLLFYFIIPKTCKFKCFHTFQTNINNLFHPVISPRDPSNAKIIISMRELRKQFKAKTHADT